MTAEQSTQELVEEARAIQAQFLEYERSHLAKGTPESNEKAKVNRQWAVRAGGLATALTVSEATIKSLLALAQQHADRLSAPPDEAGVELREQIARVIDRKLWESLEFRGALPDGYRERALAPSLAKADAILSIVLPQEGGWRPISEAPRDGTLILVFAPGKSDEWEGDLGDLICPCAWHLDAGFCVCELREPTHWLPLPPPPAAHPVGGGDE